MTQPAQLDPFRTRYDSQDSIGSAGIETPPNTPLEDCVGAIIGFDLGKLDIPGLAKEALEKGKDIAEGSKISLPKLDTKKLTGEAVKALSKARIGDVPGIQGSPVMNIPGVSDMTFDDMAKLAKLDRADLANMLGVGLDTAMGVQLKNIPGVRDLPLGSVPGLGEISIKDIAKLAGTDPAKLVEQAGKAISNLPKALTTISPAGGLAAASAAIRLLRGSAPPGEASKAVMAADGNPVSTVALTALSFVPVYGPIMSGIVSLFLELGTLLLDALDGRSEKQKASDKAWGLWNKENPRPALVSSLSQLDLEHKYGVRLKPNLSELAAKGYTSPKVKESPSLVYDKLVRDEVIQKGMQRKVTYLWQVDPKKAASELAVKTKAWEAAKNEFDLFISGELAHEMAAKRVSELALSLSPLFAEVDAGNGTAIKTLLGIQVMLDRDMQLAREKLKETQDGFAYDNTSKALKNWPTWDQIESLAKGESIVKVGSKKVESRSHEDWEKRLSFQKGKDMAAIKAQKEPAEYVKHVWTEDMARDLQKRAKASYASALKAAKADMLRRKAKPLPKPNPALVKAVATRAAKDIEKAVKKASDERGGVAGSFVDPYNRSTRGRFEQVKTGGKPGVLVVSSSGRSIFGRFRER